jgi:CheY-like chemotaxis protein
MNGCVVVVDDEPDILDVVRDILEMEGFHVVAVARPEAAEHAAQAETPAVFLMDIMMPSMSGIELARSLREGGFPETPMIAMSASPAMCEAAARSGVFEHAIAKPFDISTLIDCVEMYAA